ncbi:MAG: hypothetical protein PHW10_04200 [Candidatus Peribacteraceae bacterium]|nr:hypothetical protein [Candidatus Peribacteraceae bacterium]
MVNILSLETPDGSLVPVNAAEFPKGTTLQHADGAFRVKSAEQPEAVANLIHAATEATLLNSKPD